MPDLFKEVIPSILQTKKNVFENDEEMDRYYERNSFIILKTLSMYMDCVLQSNVINYNYHIDGKLKNDFLLNSIRGYKRKFSYQKKTKLDDLEFISEYYGISNEKAKEYVSLLTRENIDEIKKRLEKGGKEK